MWSKYCIFVTGWFDMAGARVDEAGFVGEAYCCSMSVDWFTFLSSHIVAHFSLLLRQSLLFSLQVALLFLDIGSGLFSVVISDFCSCLCSGLSLLFSGLFLGLHSGLYSKS